MQTTHRNAQEILHLSLTALGRTCPHVRASNPGLSFFEAVVPTRGTEKCALIIRESDFSASLRKSIPGCWKGGSNSLTNLFRFHPSRGTMDQLFTPAELVWGSWEFAHPVYKCFVELEKAYDRVPQETLWGVLQEYRILGTLLQNIQSLYNHSRSCVRIIGTKSNMFPMGVGLCQGCPLSLILFMIFMDRISRQSRGDECSGGLRIASIIFTGD